MTFRHFVQFALATVFAASPAIGDPLTGDVGAVESSSQGANANPANAAFVPRTEISGSPEIFRTESLQIRYPRFAPISQNESGLGSLLALGKPGFIYKLTPKIGIGGYAVPPIGLSADIHKERIPVVILDTLNYVDLDAVGTLGGAFGLTAGYRFTERLGAGLNASYQAVSFDATLTPSDGSEPLATVKGSTSDFSLGVGFRYDPRPGRLAFGVAFGLVSMHSQDSSVDSPLLGVVPAGGDGGDQGGNEATDQGSTAQAVTPLSGLLVGAQVATSRAQLMADLRYARANKEQRAYSLVELKEKRRDLYDTLALRLGASYAISSGSDALIGFRYEPSSLGPGSLSSDDGEGAIGFGTQELVMIFAGAETLTPFWQTGVGMRFDFGRQKTFDRWSISSGLVYRRASLGIDANGELPGAYLLQKTFIPLTVVCRL